MASRNLDDIPSDRQREARRKPADSCDLLKLPDDQYMRVRLFGGVTSYAGHWVRTRDKQTGQWRTGNKGSFYVPCAAWDMETGTRKGGDGAKHCPFCELEARMRADNVPNEKRVSRFSVDHYINAIVRKRAQRPPDDFNISRGEKKSGFKKMDSDSWTPVQVLRMTSSVIDKLKELKQLNTHENAEGETRAYSVTDDEFGCDVQIMKRANPSTPADTYALQKGDPKPISSKERAYLKYDLDDLTDPTDPDFVKGEYERWARYSKVEEELGGGSKARKSISDDDEDDAPRKPAKKKPIVEDDDDDFEDDAPPKKKSAKKSNDLPLDDDDDFDDEPPPKRGKKSVEDDEDDEPAPKKKRKPAEDDDDDFDDEPPPKKRKAHIEDDEDDEPKPKKRKAPVDDDEDDDFDDEPKRKPAKKKHIEDDDDEPAPKKRKAPVDDDDDDAPRKPAPKKRKPADDDDDDDIPY